MSTFAVTAVGTLPQALPPAVPALFQFQGDGVDLGAADVDTINVAGNAHVTRGTGESANVVTITGPADASEVPFTPGGNIGADDVEAAIHEVDIENRALSAAALQAAADAHQAAADAQSGADASVKTAVLADVGGASLVGTDADLTMQDYINTGIRNAIELAPKSQRVAILNGTSVYDATTALQAMLDAGGDWYVPAHSKWVSGPLFGSATKPTTIHFGAGCTIEARAGFTNNQHLLSTATGGSLTIFAGPGAKLVMRKADYSALGDFMHCLFIWQCAKTHVYGLTCEDPGGDCFYIGGNGGQPSNDVLLHGVTGKNGRRNSLSIVNIRKLRVENSTLEEANGYAFGPCAGIDIESNLLPGYYLEDVVIDRCLTRNNVGAGILVTPQSKDTPISVTVRDCVSINDGGSLTQGKGALSLTAAMAYRTVAPLTDPSNIGKIPGFVRVINQSIINPPLSGFVSTNWTENAPLTTVEGLYILNPYSSLDPGAADRQKVGVLIRGQTGSEGLYGSSIGNMTIRGLDIRDDRAVKAMHIPIYLEPSDEASKPIKDLHFEDVEVVDGEWTLATGSVPVLRAGSLAVTNYSMSYRRERKLVSSSSFTVGLTHAGMTLVASAGTSFSLPDADGKIGMDIEVELDAASTLQLPLLDATDTMRPISTVAGKGILASARSSRARLKAEAGRWRIVSTVGTWTAIP